MNDSPREAWQALYSKHGMQFGGTGDLGMLRKVMAKGSLVLDAGCGDGKTTEVLAREAEVVGCDFSKEALLSLRLVRNICESVNLVECELKELPFCSEKFDSVACVHALSHMVHADRESAALELARVLKKGGYVFVEVFGSGDLRSGAGREVEPGSFLRGNGIMTHYFAEGELGRLFASLDLTDEIRSSSVVTYGVVTGRRETIRALFHKS